MSPELDDILLLQQQQQQRSNQPSVSGRKNKNKNSSRKKKKRSTAAKTQAQAQEPQTQTQTQSVVDSLGNGDGQQDGIFSVTENTSVVDNHDYGQGNMVISYLPSSGDAMEMDTPTSESSMTVGADEAVSSITSTDDFGGTERTTTPAGPLIVDSASWSGYQQPPQLPQSQYEPVAATDVGSSMSVGDMVDVVYGSDSFLEIVPPAKDEGVAEIADDGDGTENTVHPPSFDGYQSQTEFEESSCGSEKAVNESSTDSRGDDKSDLKVDAGAEKPVSYADNKALHWPRVSETRRSCSFPLGMESAADTTPAGKRSFIATYVMSTRLVRSQWNTQFLPVTVLSQLLLDAKEWMLSTTTTMKHRVCHQTLLCRTPKNNRSTQLEPAVSMICFQVSIVPLGATVRLRRSTQICQATQNPIPKVASLTQSLNRIPRNQNRTTGSL